ncbi:hypothetical protein [Alkanindiges illinoisensis]|uniref:Uncharacterized protein n=1 Tax=Alkanindiges illinoisensis TaxID=197183 RepID=A0A4Y7XAG2_9GAMM|nr:hypothetical protein [Alkanindiges illinoisensis]TEU24957.1 hypothetical protein E2B99_10350 [Alkanindiges illinoisensis]
MTEIIKLFHLGFWRFELVFLLIVLGIFLNYFSIRRAYQKYPLNQMGNKVIWVFAFLFGGLMGLFLYEVNSNFVSYISLCLWAPYMSVRKGFYSIGR